MAAVATPPAARHWQVAMRHMMEKKGLTAREAFVRCANVIANGRCRSEDPGARGEKFGLLLEAFLEITTAAELRHYREQAALYEQQRLTLIAERDALAARVERIESTEGA